MKKTKKKILIAVVLFLLISFVIGYIITAGQMKKNFVRGDYPEKELDATWFYDHYEKEYPREEVSFKSGENNLTGYIYGVDNDKGLIVFAHGIGTGHESYLGLITSLVDRGWSVFAYDATGSGHSEGEGTNGLAQSVIDLDKAFDLAETDPRLKDRTKYVLGHSWGGYASASVLNFDHDIKACVTLSGYNSPFEELAETCDGMYGIAGKLLYPIIWLYNKTTFGKDSSWTAVDGINKSGIPVTVVHGTEDDIIAYDGAAIIAHKDDITNPNVKYVTFSEEGRNGHNTYFYTNEYKKYLEKELDPAWKALQDKYDGDIPREERVKFIESVDKELYNGTNLELIDLIDFFFTENID